MTVALQLVGAVAIVLGLLGTWLAGRLRAGWLVCVVSSLLWLPALVTGDQWAAVVNCALSIAICVRNFCTGGSGDALAEVPVRGNLPERRHRVAGGVGTGRLERARRRIDRDQQVGSWVVGGKPEQLDVERRDPEYA
jgi:hypothetical protein